MNLFYLIMEGNDYAISCHILIGERDTLHKILYIEHIA